MVEKKAVARRRRLFHFQDVICFLLIFEEFLILTDVKIMMQGDYVNSQRKISEVN